MDVLLVARRPQSRWELAAALGLPAAAACDPAFAVSRLAHPSAPRPDVVLLLVGDRADLHWLRRQTARSDASVPIVAAVTTPEDAAAAKGAGARVVVAADASAGAIGRALRAALAPAVVIDIDSTRTA